MCCFGVCVGCGGVCVLFLFCFVLFLFLFFFFVFVFCVLMMLVELVSFFGGVILLKPKCHHRFLFSNSTLYF